MGPAYSQPGRSEPAGHRIKSAATRQVLTELQPTADWGEIDLPAVSPAVDAWEVTLVWAMGLPSSAL